MIRLRGRYYATHPSANPQGVYLPRQVPIETHVPVGPNPTFSKCRFPFPENVMRQKRKQPYVHNCRVVVYDNNTNRTYRFIVFFKRHLHLHPNPALMRMVFPALPTLQGDVVVMSIGIKYNFVNMPSSDIEIVDWMMMRYVYP